MMRITHYFVQRWQTAFVQPQTVLRCLTGKMTTTKAFGKLLIGHFLRKQETGFVHQNKTLQLRWVEGGSGVCALL